MRALDPTRLASVAGGLGLWRRNALRTLAGETNGALDRLMEGSEHVDRLPSTHPIRVWYDRVFDEQLGVAEAYHHAAHLPLWRRLVRAVRPKP